MTNPNERLILVSGATGQQDGAVARRHLLREGVQVRALTRDSDQEAARALTDAGAEVVEGSFDDRASLDHALDGAYGAFSFEEQSGEEMTVMYRWFEDVGYDADIEALRETHPGLQRLEPFLREHGWDTMPD